MEIYSNYIHQPSNHFFSLTYLQPTHLPSAHPTYSTPYSPHYSGPDLESVSNLENAMNGDGMESRGSASPKSYTSHSSLEDKFPNNIRMAPIPECIKVGTNLTFVLSFAPISQIM